MSVPKLATVFPVVHRNVCLYCGYVRPTVKDSVASCPPVLNKNGNVINAMGTHHFRDWSAADFRKHGIHLRFLRANRHVMFNHIMLLKRVSRCIDRRYHVVSSSAPSKCVDCGYDVHDVPTAGRTRLNTER